MNDLEIIGLFPAGGKATRLGVLPCSKEIIPLASASDNVQVVGDYLLNAYKAAGIKKVIIIIRSGKFDICKHYADGHAHQLNLSYQVLRYPWGTPFTLDQAYPYVKNNIIALGFPDIILKPSSVFTALKEKLLNGDDDIVLGLFSTDSPHKADMVHCDHLGRVKHLDIKPTHSKLTHTWVIAMWRPRFTEFLHHYMQDILPLFQSNPNTPEPFVGTVINAAIDNQYRVSAITFDDGYILDIGTPKDLRLAFNNND